MSYLVETSSTSSEATLTCRIERNPIALTIQAHCGALKTGSKLKPARELQSMITVRTKIQQLLAISRFTAEQSNYALSIPLKMKLS